MIVDVYAERKTKQVMKETWGHLAPVPRHRYRGFILFCATPLNDHLLLDFDFHGLDGNPWTMDHVSDWWSDETRDEQYEPGDEVRVWRWEGTYTVLKNETAKFSGKVVSMSIRAALSEHPQ